ncbi:hypothetical protein FKM82_019382 [Ascaphus truei]
MAIHLATDHVRRAGASVPDLVSIVGSGSVEQWIFTALSNCYRSIYFLFNASSIICRPDNVQCLKEYTKHMQ